MSSSQKYKAELYDEVWQKATSMGYMNVTMALESVAALRGELAKFDEGMRALACSLGAGGYNAETLTADQLVGKVQWGIDNLITVHERRLTAAEQRNAELAALLQRVVDSSVLSFEQDAPEDLESLEADICAALVK